MSQKVKSVLTPTAEAELRRFGWTLGPEFDRRYLTDAWVFNLVNALAVVATERDEARAALEVSDE